MESTSTTNGQKCVDRFNTFSRMVNVADVKSLFLTNSLAYSSVKNCVKRGPFRQFYVQISVKEGKRRISWTIDPDDERKPIVKYLPLGTGVRYLQGNVDANNYISYVDDHEPPLYAIILPCCLYTNFVTNVRRNAFDVHCCFRENSGELH